MSQAGSISNVTILTDDKRIIFRQLFYISTFKSWLGFMNLDKTSYNLKIYEFQLFACRICSAPSFTQAQYDLQLVG